MARLIVCGSCERHVHDTEAQCPFCDAPMGRAPLDLAIPGLSRAAQVARRALTGANVAALLTGVAACKDDVGGRSPVDVDLTNGSTATSGASTASGAGTVGGTSATGGMTTTGAAACGNATCPAGQYCMHACSTCGGRARQAGMCGPDPLPSCVAAPPPEGARVQGNDVYPFCPAMPYGCVFPNDCGRLSV